MHLRKLVSVTASRDPVAPGSSPRGPCQSPLPRRGGPGQSFGLNRLLAK